MTKKYCRKAVNKAFFKKRSKIKCRRPVHENFSRMDDQIWKDISEAEMEGFLACAEKIIRNLEDV